MDRHAKQQTITLMERKPTLCRLRQADVDFLLAEHSSHLELISSGRRGSYRCTPSSHVGVIAAPSCRIVIRPKIPMQSLFHLLDETGSLSVTEDYSAPTPGAEALDFLALRLARLLDERAAAGLHRAYTERAEQGRFLQGRLDLPAQLRSQGKRKDHFHCHFEEFTADVPCNQIPKATAELTLRSPILGASARAALQRSLKAFGSVSCLPLGADSFATAASDRSTKVYLPLLGLCQLLYEGLSPGEYTGTTPCPAFLLDMERVFERYCTARLQEAFPTDRGDEYAVSVQPLVRADRPRAQQSPLVMRPDLTIDRNGKPVLVLDAKWKRLTTTPLVTADVYQVLAYCTALGLHRAVLVYPGTRNRTWRYRLARSSVGLVIHTLQVTGSRQACIQSAQRLVRLVQRLAGVRQRCRK
jgi:5-methylcytosine-specific restriction enzyme subunit McrC